MRDKSRVRFQQGTQTNSTAHRMISIYHGDEVHCVVKCFVGDGDRSRSSGKDCQWGDRRGGNKDGLHGLPWCTLCCRTREGTSMEEVRVLGCVYALHHLARVRGCILWLLGLRGANASELFFALRNCTSTGGSHHPLSPPDTCLVFTHSRTVVSCCLLAPAGGNIELNSN